MVVLGKQWNVVFHDSRLAIMILKKCGSVTLHKTILSSLGHKNLSGSNINQVFRNDLTLMDKYEISKLNYTTVVWVRNPFDRLVSGWFHRIRRGMFELPITTTFEEFIEWMCSIEDANMNVHFRQQTYDITIKGKLVPNFIIKLGNLNEGWKLLQKKQPWLADIKGRANASNKGDYRKYYTNTMIEKVKIRFKDDLDLLEYTFER